MTLTAVAEDYRTSGPTMGLYPGSFDPITRGHTDIIRQGLEVFDTMRVSVGYNPKKNRLFSTAVAEHLIRHAIREEGLPESRIVVDTFEGSVMHHARTENASAIVRGLRQVSDFNDEFTLHGVFERTLSIPVIYLICRQEYLHVSSSTARELASLGEKMDWLVHPTVEKALKARVLIKS